MAQQSPALMGAMMALAAIQTSHLNKERKSIMANAQKHYDMGLQGNFAALLRGELMDTDIPLATSLLLSFYEVCICFISTMSIFNKCLAVEWRVGKDGCSYVWWKKHHLSTRKGVTYN